MGARSLNIYTEKTLFFCVNMNGKILKIFKSSSRHLLSLPGSKGCIKPICVCSFRRHVYRLRNPRGCLHTGNPPAIFSLWDHLPCSHEQGHEQVMVTKVLDPSSDDTSTSGSSSSMDTVHQKTAGGLVWTIWQFHLLSIPEGGQLFCG